LEWHKKPIEVEATLIRFHSSFYSEYVQGIGVPLLSIILTEVIETFPVPVTAGSKIRTLPSLMQDYLVVHRKYGGASLIFLNPAFVPSFDLVVSETDHVGGPGN
jgi:hypothetical protein